MQKQKVCDVCASRLKRGPLIMQFYNHNGNKIPMCAESKILAPRTAKISRLKS
jgi:hypothetical protein